MLTQIRYAEDERAVAEFEKRNLGILTTDGAPLLPDGSNLSERGKRLIKIAQSHLLGGCSKIESLEFALGTERQFWQLHGSN